MKIYYTSILILLSISFSSCEKILDKDPTDKISMEDLFKDVAGSKTALAGAYSSLRDMEHYQRNSMVYQDLLGGNIKYSQLTNIQLDNVYNAVQTSTDSQMNGTYAGLYQEENNINNILQFTPAAKGSTAEKVKIIAEAKCLRALIHFDLVRTFARPYQATPNASHPGIVVNLKPRLLGDLSAERATVAQTYQSIVTDLEEAISSFDATNVAVLKGGTKQNYFTALSAKALLSKVYLYANNWEKGYALADEIIKSNQYTLLTNANYAASWISPTASSESILEVPIEANFTGTSLGSYYSITDNMYRAYAATNDLLTLYSETDVRGNPSLFNLLVINGNSFYFTKKYTGGTTLATPLKLLRLTELYLIRAEAAVEKSTANFSVANADLSVIVKRADPAAVFINYTDKASLVAAILLERRKELAFEGNLLYDLLRKGLPVNRADCQATNCNLAANDYRLIMPFPATTINANRSVVQNAGY